MQLRAKIIRVAEVATITVDCQDPDTVSEYLKETVKKFPEKIDYQKPNPDEDIIIQIEEAG